MSLEAVANCVRLELWASRLAKMKFKSIEWCDPRRGVVLGGRRFTRVENAFSPAAAHVFRVRRRDVVSTTSVWKRTLRFH